MRFAGAPSSACPIHGAATDRRVGRAGVASSRLSPVDIVVISPDSRYRRRDDEQHPADQPGRQKETGRPVVDRDTAGPRHDAACHDFSRDARKAARDPSSRNPHRISPTPSSHRAAGRRAAPSLERVRPRARARAGAHRPAVRHVAFDSQSLHHLTFMEAFRSSARPVRLREFLRDRRAPNASRFDHAKSRPHRISSGQPRLAWRAFKGGFKIRSILKLRF